MQQYKLADPKPSRTYRRNTSRGTGHQTLAEAPRNYVLSNSFSPYSGSRGQSKLRRSYLEVCQFDREDKVAVVCVEKHLFGNVDRRDVLVLEQYRPEDLFLSRIKNV